MDRPGAGGVCSHRRPCASWVGLSRDTGLHYSVASACTCMHACDPSRQRAKNTCYHRKEQQLYSCTCHWSEHHRVLMTLLQPHDQGWRRAKPGWRRCGRSARRRSGRSACPRRRTRSTALQTSRPCYSWSRRRACLPRSGTGHTGYTQLCDVVERFSQCWLAIFQASLCAFTVFLS